MDSFVGVVEVNGNIVEGESFLVQLFLELGESGLELVGGVELGFEGVDLGLQ